MPYEHQTCVKRIRELMGQVRLDMKNLSKKAGLGETTVRDLLVRSDKGNPRVQTVFRIAEALKVPPAYLLGVSNVADIEPAKWDEYVTLLEQLPADHQEEILQLLRVKTGKI